ncbi:MAG: TonB-dependent receptor plug domain-containing protein [bacterium]|nr:TonB-dependent receptor plug domain-containing protein [bacterium]
MRFGKDAASGGKQFARIGGSNVNQVMVLLDGIRISDVGSGETDLSRIPAEWIESIEVSTGGSTAFGGEAIGGAISIRTSKISLSNFTTTARGSETSTQVGARQDWTKGNTYTSIGVTREQGEGNYRFRVTEDDGNGPFTVNLGETFRRENNALLRDRLTGKFSHDFGRHEVSGSAWVDRSEFGLPGYLAPRPTPLASQEEQFRQAQLSWIFNSEVGRLSATAGLQNQMRDFSDPDTYSYLHQSHEASERVSMATSLQRKVRHINISWNTRTERERLESGVLKNTRAARNRWQTSLQFERVVKLGSAARQTVNCLFGTSVERFGDAEVQALPSGEVSYANHVSIPFTMGVRGSRAYLAPSFYSLFWNDELLAQGNPDLRPESSQMWQGFFKARTLSQYETAIEISASNNRVDDLIYWRQAFDGRWTPQNLRNATLDQLTVGVEQVVLLSHLDAKLSMEWLEARDHSGERVADGKYLIYRPLRTFHTALNWQTLGFRGLIRTNWVDKQAILETNSKWLAEYTIVDMEMSRKFDLGSTTWDAGLRCDNVFDMDYRVVRFAPMPLREYSIFLSCNLGSGL